MMTKIRRACGARHKGPGFAPLLVGLGLSAALWLAGSLPAAGWDRGSPGLSRGAAGQPPPAAEHGTPAAAGTHGTEAAHGAAEGHEGEGGGILSLVGKIVNSAILVGTLLYFLRAPVAQYLDDRMTAVRQDLVTAADTRAAASAQLEDLGRRLEQQPGEIDDLRSRGARELAAEEGRLEHAAQIQRERLLEQTRREIDLQGRAAERELRTHAADMAVRLATERIRRTVTDADQLRLIDRYVEQMTPDGRTSRT